MSGQPRLFDTFMEGRVIGRTETRIDETLMRGWAELYGAVGDGERPSAAIVVPLLMRAYGSVVTPRPPGNVHVRNRLHLRETPEAGEPVTIEFRCAGKEVRNARRYLELAAEARGESSRLLFTAHMTMIWAA